MKVRICYTAKTFLDFLSLEHPEIVIRSDSKYTRRDFYAHKVSFESMKICGMYVLFL